MSAPIRLRKLVGGDIIRDGGSYELTIEDDCGELVTVFLARSHGTPGRDLKHKGLYAYRGTRMPTNALPFLSGSAPEIALLDAISDVLRSTEDRWSRPYLRAHEFMGFSRRREPTLKADIDALVDRNERLIADVAAGVLSADDYLFAEPLTVCTDSTQSAEQDVAATP